MSGVNVEKENLLLLQDEEDVIRLGRFTRLNWQWNFLWVFFSISAGLMYGYNCSIAAVLPYIASAFSLTTTQTEFVSAAATLTDVFSMVIGGFLADKFGRKAIALLSCLCSISGGVFGGWQSSDFTSFIVWRFCVGIGNGLSILVLPMYMSENLSASLRGKYLPLFQVGVAVGTTIPYGSMVIWEEWRICMFIGALPALFILICFAFWFPESQSWMNQQDSNSIRSDMEEGKQPTTKYENSLMELFVGVLMAFTNNSIDPFLFYGPEILVLATQKNSTSHTEDDLTPLQSNYFGIACTALTIFPVILTARFLVVKFSRRKLYLSSLLVVVSGFFFTSFLLELLQQTQGSLRLALCICLGITFISITTVYQCGPGSLFIVILNELFQDPSSRAKYTSICTFFMSFFSLLINGSLLSTIEVLGLFWTFLVYGVVFMLCFIVFLKWLPETKHRQMV